MHFDHLPYEIYVGNRPVIWTFIPVKIDLFADRNYHSLFLNLWVRTTSKRLINNTGKGNHYDNNEVFDHPGWEAVK